jgi:hypothetical protein
LASSFYSIRLLDEKERTSKSLVFASRNKIWISFVLSVNKLLSIKEINTMLCYDVTQNKHNLLTLRLAYLTWMQVQREQQRRDSATTSPS